MSTTATNWKKFFKHSEIETGVQSFFAATGSFVAPPSEDSDTRETWQPNDGVTPCFTAFQAQLFQKHKPRIALELNGVKPFSYQSQAIVDDRGIIRPTLYVGTLSFSIVTAENYTEHTDLRALVAVLCNEIAPFVQQGTSSTIGANQYLTNFVIVRVDDNGQETNIMPDDGYYMSALSYPITFAWRRDQLPT